MAADDLRWEHVCVKRKQKHWFGNWFRVCNTVARNVVSFEPLVEVGGREQC